MTQYKAISIIEGIDGKEHTEEEVLQAFASLIRTGAAWRLQGWYGRHALDLIQSGVISEEGEILN